MSEIIALLKGVVDDFSWKKARTLAAVAGVLAIAFFSYDRYSDHTRVSRLKQLAEVAKILDEIDKEKSTALQYAKQQLNGELKAEALNAPSLSEDIDSIKRWPWPRFGYSLLLLGPFLVLAFITNPSADSADKRFAISASIVILVIAGCLGLMIPETQWWPYSHVIGIPLLIYFLILMSVVLTGGAKKEPEKVPASAAVAPPHK